MIQNVKKVVVDASWILGGAFGLVEGQSNDPRTTKFYIMQIQSNGSYKVVN